MKKIWTLGLILLITMSIATAHASKDTVKLYLFYAQESGGLEVVEEVIQPISNKYPVEIKSFSVNELKNYDLLVRFEKELKSTESDLPAVILGDRILGGKVEIQRNLEKLVKSHSEKGGTSWPSIQMKREKEGWIPHPPLEEEKKLEKMVYGAFFYMPGCLHCEEMKAELKKWVPRFPDLRIRVFSLAKEENKRLDEALSQIYHIPESKRLVDHKLYIGEDYLWAEDLHLESFEKLVTKYQGIGSPPPWEKVTREGLEKGGENIVERFKKWSASAILIAGLIDGVNPCAFATIIFLVSYLTLAGKKGREILLYGGVFTSGVFIAYLLVGLGLMTFLHELSTFPLISKGVYLVIAFFAFGLGLISLYDYLLFRRGQVTRWKLQLPMGLKKKVHGIIREQIQSKGGYLATFGAGFVIAVCTVICTGQVYLPTIASVMAIPELRKNAVLNLLFYNVMYIVPLVGVFTLTFFGVTSEKIALITRKHTGTVKFLTAMLFFSLASLLFFLH